MKEFIQAYWRQLAEREQRLVGLGGIVLGLLGLYAIVYWPLKQAVQTKQQALVVMRDALAWMKQVEPVLLKKEALETLTSARLLTVFADQLQKTAFKQYPYHLEQAGAQAIQLTFAEVPYVAFMTWLNKMSTRYAFSIQQLQMIRTDKSGLIKLLLVIEVNG